MLKDINKRFQILTQLPNSEKFSNPQTNLGMKRYSMHWTTYNNKTKRGHYLFLFYYFSFTILPSALSKFITSPLETSVTSK